LHTVRICDFRRTEARKLTVGLVLGLFLLVASVEGAEGRPVPSAPKISEMIMAEVYSFANPPLEFKKVPASYRKLASWMQKMRSNAAAGDYQGHQDLGSWLRSLAWPKTWEAWDRAAKTAAPAPSIHPNLQQGHSVKARWMVVPWKTGRMKTSIEQTIIMPEMVIASSVLPALQGKLDAWGVFAPKDIQKGTVVAIYGGMVTERGRAEELFWARHGSHLKSRA
jgi:hypothetical protein